MHRLHDRNESEVDQCSHLLVTTRIESSKARPAAGVI